MATLRICHNSYLRQDSDSPDSDSGSEMEPRAYRRRGHATPPMPAKCWRLLKIEPNVWAGGKGSCAVCVDFQAVGTLEFFGEFYSLAKGFGPFLRGFWAGFREREGSVFSNHQHFAVSTGICGVACPLLLYTLDGARERARGRLMKRISINLAVWTLLANIAKFNTLQLMGI